MRTVKRALLVSFTGLAVVTASACGSGGDGEDPTADAAGGTAGGECKADEAQERVDAAKEVPAWEPPGPAFDAQAAEGSLIYTINEHSANEFGQAQVAGIMEAAEHVGVEVVDYPNQGSKEQWIQGVNTAVNAGADAIIFVGGTIGPIYFASQAQEARDAGVKLITLIATDITQPAQEGVDARVGQRYAEAARLDADWIIADSNCNANVLVLTTNELIAGDINQKAAEDEFAQLCGEGCNVEFQNIPLPNWTSQIQPTVQSAIQADPDLNYIMPLYDAMVQFTVPAVTLAGASDRIKIATFNGTPAILGMIGPDSPVKMDVGENPAQLGYAAMDQAMREITGVGGIESGDENVRLRIFDESNIAEAGDPPALGVGYGEEWKSGYLEMWGIDN